MFCRNCGKEMRDDASFCPNCGALNAPGASAPQNQSWGSAAPAVEEPVSRAGGQKRRGLGLIIGAGVAAVAVIALLVVTVSSLFTSPKGRVEKAFTQTTDIYQEVGEKLNMPDLNKLRDSRTTRFSLELKSINSQLVGYDLSDLYGLGLRMSSNYSGKDRKLDAQLAAFWDEDEIASVQMLFDDSNMYLGSPQFTGDTFFGLNTETLGMDLADLSGDDSVEDLSFNVFDLMDIMMKAEPDKDMDKAVKNANKALKAAVEIKKTGSKTMDINGKSTKTTAYHVVIPQDALEDYVDALEDVMSSVDYMDMYEEMLKAAGMSKSQINSVMSGLGDADVYGELADAVKDILDELGDVELDVYLSGGRVSAVIYEERIQGTKVEIGLYLGGGERYEDDLSLEIKAAGAEITLESTGNHTAKGGTFTDETTISIREGGSSLGRLTSEMSYKLKGGDFSWEIGVDSSGSSLGKLEMEGTLVTSKDSLDLKVDEMSVRTMGIKLFSIGMEYYVGPCKGMEVSVKSPVMLADMDEYDIMDLAYDIQENAQDWVADMEDLFGSRLPDELLWALMYGF